MKNKITIFVILLLAMILAPTIAGAVGSCIDTLYSISNDQRQMVILLTCTGDPTVADTDIDNTDISSAFNGNYWVNGFYLFELWVQIPSGGDSPDLADITVTDATGAALFDEDNVIPASGTNAGNVNKVRCVSSMLSVTVENQATNPANWNIYLKLVR